MSANMPAPAPPQTEEQKKMAEQQRILDMNLASAREHMKLELKDEFVRRYRPEEDQN
jgi:hypothetical protein